MIRDETTLDVRVEPEINDAMKGVTGLGNPVCPELSCSDRSNNYVCYSHYDSCPFYQAHERQQELERQQSVKLKRRYKS